MTIRLDRAFAFPAQAASMHADAIFATGLRTYRDVDYTYAKAPTVFQALLAAAGKGTIPIPPFVDSQETSMGGRGYVYIPRLCYNPTQNYGNESETPIAGSFSTPNAQWLLNRASAGPGPAPSRIDAEILAATNPSPGEIEYFAQRTITLSQAILPA